MMFRVFVTAHALPFLIAVSWEARGIGAIKDA